MDGYKEAEKSDAITNPLLEQNPINKDNVLEWMKYARTVKTTMDIILSECQHIIKGDDPLYQGWYEKQIRDDKWKEKNCCAKHLEETDK